MAAQEFNFPKLGTQVQDRATLLAIDDYSLPLMHDLCYFLSKPRVHPQPVLVPRRDNRKAPDFLGTHFYGTVLQDEGKFRMWYYAVGLGETPAEILEGPVCYAESDDGMQWTRPSLGRTLYKGDRDNNVLGLPGDRTDGPNVIKDEDDPDPMRQYKMVYEYHAPIPRKGRPRLSTIRTATSPDGIAWEVGPEVPIDDFIEQASFYKYDGLYIINGQSVGPFSRSEDGNMAGRQGYVWISPDFNTWLPEKGMSFLLPENPDPANRGSKKAYDQVHLGTGAAILGNVLVGLYSIWHQKENFHEISGDLGLVVSNDGIHFREPVKSFVYLWHHESPATPAPGASYPTVLCQSNGILNVGDETRIYHGRWRNARYSEDYYAEIALATLPRDRWGAVGIFPGEGKGSVWSTPIKLPQGDWELSLNGDGARGMRVEIGDERFNLLPQFSGEHAGTTAAASGLDCPVHWAQANLASLAGRTVRLKCHLDRAGDADPRLYALYLKEG